MIFQMPRRAYRLLVCALLCLSVLFSSAAVAAATCAHHKDESTCDICKFSAHEVETKHPDLVKLNLFDYWLTPNRTDADSSANDDLKGDGWQDGINYDHVSKKPHILHFRKGNYTVVTPESGSVSFADMPAGLVKSTLGGDGYPVAHKLKGATISTAAQPVYNQMPAQESLAYLFDPEIEHEGKASFPDVRGLFQLDADGYYYYNSMQESLYTADLPADLDAQEKNDVEFTRYGGAYHSANYAYFDEEDYRFRVYDNIAVYLNKRTSTNLGSFNMNGQFFPFDGPSEVFDANSISSSNLTPLDVGCASENFNHFMGFTLEVPFVQTPGGKTTDGKNQDTIFYFSGDDDMWLYIDGVLVGDLGGIHDAFTMEVNFATGKVKLNGNYETAANRREYNLKDLFSAAGANVDEIFTNNGLFKDGSQHVIKMFFLERGHNASNMGIKFNLETQITPSLIKVDQDGNAVANAEFALYEADADYNKGNQIFKGKTDLEGKLFLIDAQGQPITFSTLRGDQFVLSELSTPEGYRNSGEMHLVKHTLPDNSITLISDPDSATGGKWSTGSYAAATLLATVPQTPGVGTEVMHFSNPDGTKGAALTDAQLEDGTMFAVVLKRVNFETGANLNNHHNWRPVYGDPLNGYHLVDVENDSEDAFAAAVKKAILNSPYPFSIGASGKYEVHIEHLPGDILNYAHDGGTIDDSVHYTVFYGWTDAASLTEEALNAAAQFKRLYSDAFNLHYSANFMALNNKETFHVLKTDEDGKPLQGVQFNLYKDSVSGQLFDTAVTDEEGMVKFPSETGPMLTNGDYYLVEAAPLEGYVARTDAIHVHIDNSGVYADAGEANDGVTVRRCVGKIVDTMHEFGTNDDLDVTLHNIVFTPYAASDLTGILAGGTAQGEKVHLHHKEHHGENEEHGFVVHPDPNHPEAETGNAYYENDTGWSRLKIQQCSEICEHDANSGYSTTFKPVKENLGDRDITKLFTSEVTIVIANKLKSTQVVIEGQKSLTGREMEAGEFTFRITPVGSAPMPENVFVLNEADGSFQFAPIKFTYGMHLSGGEYEYRVEEVQGNNANIIYDQSYWIVKVAVSYVNGNMQAETTYTHYDAQNNVIAYSEEPTEAAFSNIYYQNTEVVIKGRKNLEGRAPVKDEFAFQITPIGNAPQPPKTHAYNEEDGSFRFAPIPITYGMHLDAAEYTYRVEEVPGNSTNIIYDRSYWIVKVAVSYVNGNMQAETTYTHYDAQNKMIAYDEAPVAAAFSNIFYQNTEMVIEGQKILKGRAPVKGEFAFKITPIGDAPKLQETIAYNEADGSFRFAPIPLTYGMHLSGKEYAYRIEEVIGKDEKIFYDRSYWIVKLNVSYVEGKMTAKITYTHYNADSKTIEAKEAPVIFTNTFYPPNTGDDSALMLWAALMVLSAGGIVLLLKRRAAVK